MPANFVYRENDTRMILIFKLNLDGEDFDENDASVTKKVYGLTHTDVEWFTFHEYENV